GDIRLNASPGNGTGAGGLVSIISGNSGGSNDGGEISLISGDGGTGNGGLITLQPSVVGTEPGYVNINGQGSVIVMDVLAGLTITVPTDHGALWIRDDNKAIFTD